MNELIVKMPQKLEKIDLESNFNEKINKIDAQNMYQLLADYRKHIINAAEIAQKGKVIFNENAPKDILILGIGGSAMSGVLLRSYLKYLIGTKFLKIRINRNWNIPDDINEKTCVFVCSYSGNTEETLSAFSKVQKFTKNIIGVTSGGKLAEECKKNQYSVLDLPEGMMPRCAMFYSFFHLLFTVVRNGLIKDNFIQLESSLNEIFSDKFNKNLDFSAINDKNFAIILANSMKNNLPIIYSAEERLEAVNLRWRAQIQENANQLCFGNFSPELNHNEINGWVFPKDLLEKFVIISMIDSEDENIINENLECTLDLLHKKNITVINIKANEKYLLSRIIKLICLGDWVSFYLAIFNGVNPTPIPEISELKKLQNQILKK